GFDPADFGQHFLIGLERQPALSEHDRRLLETLRPAGIILFKDNFRRDLPYEDWLAALATLLAEARIAIGRDELLVAIDHEGGAVLRPPAPITPFAAPRDWPDRAFEVGRAMGTELRSLGVNVDFAP